MTRSDTYTYIFPSKEYIIENNSMIYSISSISQSLLLNNLMKLLLISQINKKNIIGCMYQTDNWINQIVFYRMATRKTVSPLLWNSTNKIEHDLLSSPEYPSTSSDLRMIPQPPPPPKVYYIQQQRQRGRHQHAVNFT